MTDHAYCLLTFQIALEGLRVRTPPGISAHMSKLIKICMNEEPGKRPRFDMIIPILNKMKVSGSWGSSDVITIIIITITSTSTTISINYFPKILSIFLSPHKQLSVINLSSSVVNRSPLPWAALRLFLWLAFSLPECTERPSADRSEQSC